MSQLNSISYYRGREQRERELAGAAKNPAIAAIHEEMADRYAELVNAPVAFFVNAGTATPTVTTGDASERFGPLRHSRMR